MLDAIMYDSFGTQITYLVQWDVDQTVSFEGVNISTNTAPIVHFCNKNSDKALGVQSTLDDGIINVKIPNVLLKEAETIVVYFYSNNRSVEITKIPVRPKPQPNDYFYSDNVEVVTLSELIAQVKSLDSTVTTNEVVRQNSESTREKNETARVTAENSRSTAEKTRVSNENTRQSNESIRQTTSAETIQKCLDALEKVKNTVDALESSYQKVSASEANVVQIEKDIIAVQNAINETKGEIDEMVKNYLISETQNMLNEIKRYLEEIQNAKIGLSLNVSAGDAHSFDVQNIMGGNAFTIDSYKYESGDSTTIDD